MASSEPRTQGQRDAGGGAAPGGSPPSKRALAAFGLRPLRIDRIPTGLVHESFAVRTASAGYVLQRVNPIFSPGIHDNIRAVTEHLRRRGLLTFEVLPTASGAPYVDLGKAGVWRILTQVPGVCFESCSGPGQARAAAALVARFHNAVADLDHTFHPLGFPWHDLPHHVEELEAALADHPSHPLRAAVAVLAEQIVRGAETAEPRWSAPLRAVHADLKFSNVLFAGARGTARERALCLIDLDTVCRLPLYIELGDAWRSWANRRGEDSPHAELDLGILRVAVEGYFAALHLELGHAERASLGLGLERMSLELAARFAADALNERYFGWDPRRFPSRGDHNLVRARGQLSLYRQARARRGELAGLLSGALGRSEGRPAG